MCLGVPCRIVEIDRARATATVEVLGATRDVSVMLVADDVAVDDWVVVHVGFAIGRIDPDEAARTLDLLHDAFQAELDEFGASNDQASHGR